MTKSAQSLATRAIHAGEPRPGILGAVIAPVFQSASFEYTGVKDRQGPRYLRLNNTPNHLWLHRKLASLENAEDALSTASGMAAISTSLLSMLGSGDHLLAQNCLYGGTYDLLTQDLPALGIAADFFDPSAPRSWKSLLRPNTKAIYVETLSNPLLGVGDLEGVVRFAREHRLISLIDNTFASPVNFRPAEWGFDLSLHSATKYLNGHADIVAGAVIGKADLVARVKRRLDHLGGCLDPHSAFLLNRGLKTLVLRVERQNASALGLARFLARHPAVGKVNHPGLPSHPEARRARRLLDGFGGVLSFELRGGLKAARRLLSRLALPIVAPSVGGVETLITLPIMTSHRSLSSAERRRLGIADGLVRLSLGVEDAGDLILDFKQALQSASGADRLSA